MSFMWHAVQHVEHAVNVNTSITAKPITNTFINNTVKNNTLWLKCCVFFTIFSSLSPFFSSTVSDWWTDYELIMACSPRCPSFKPSILLHPSPVFRQLCSASDLWALGAFSSENTRGHLVLFHSHKILIPYLLYLLKILWFEAFISLKTFMRYLLL